MPSAVIQNRFLVRVALLSLIAAILIPTQAVQAIGFMNSSIWFSQKVFFAGQNIRIYAMLVNDSGYDIKGTVEFLNNGQSIGTEAFSQAKDQTNQVVWHDWLAVYQNAKIEAKIVEMKAYAADGKSLPIAIEHPEATMSAEVFIDMDTDGDNIGNAQDEDDDGDGIKDVLENTNGTDPLSQDTDGDGVKDAKDIAPTDPKIGLAPDSDGDGTPDPQDSDDDNDGLYDWEEETLKTNPRKYDSDGDGVGDKQDAYPADKLQQENEKEVVTNVSAATNDSPLTDIVENHDNDNVGANDVLQEIDTRQSQVTIDDSKESDESKKTTSSKPFISSVRTMISESAIRSTAVAAFILLFLFSAFQFLRPFFKKSSDKK